MVFSGLLILHVRGLHKVEPFLTSPGESVPVDEQLSSRNKKNSSSETAAVIDSLAPPPVPLSDEEKTQYETLITDLYHQLDDKVSLTCTITWITRWVLPLPDPTLLFCLNLWNIKNLLPHVSGWWDQPAQSDGWETQTAADRSGRGESHLNVTISAV